MTPPTAPPVPSRLVLIGHGMVGQRFLEALQEHPAAARRQVTVLAAEPRPAYDRVHLTSLFTGTAAEELTLCPPGFLEEHGIRLRLDDAVVDIDRDSRTVTTAAGHRLGYDALVLATGSYPFVPPVPGHDARGCHAYRTTEDAAAIRARAATATSGIVIGGGLLGLEAAGALRALGLDTRVVEFAPHLMAVQIDPAGGALLRRKVEEQGITVHTGAAAERIETGPDGEVTAVHLSDGTRLATELVVFSAGVRPEDRLARGCGLPVGERGGILVDTACRTADPDIWAIGECARTADGKVHGLVAPGYAMAETVARQLCGESGEFTGADGATQLKLLGVEVASFGDAHGTTEGALDVTYANSRSGIYQKLIVSPEGMLLGGVLVGDTAAYATLRPLAAAGTPLPVPAEQLLFPRGGSAEAVPLPEEAVICSCHNVSKAAIRAAVTEGGCHTVAAVRKCTKAGTGCGGCEKTIAALVRESGTPAETGLCEHFRHSRAELYEIIKVKNITTFGRLLAEHGTGQGCAVCKPVIASILAGLGDSPYILDGEQAALQDTNDHFLANLQRNGSYSVVPRIPGGEITPDGLITIGAVARDFGLYTKITGGQRIDLFGATVDQLPAIWRRLVDAGFESGHAYGKALRTVKSCVGQTWCRYGVQDSTALAIELELRYRGLRAPHKIKAAVSGCVRECAEAQSKDFGVIATAKGWNLYVGGNGGATPRHADLLLTEADRDTLIRTIDRFLMFYIRTAEPLERTAPWLERLEGGLAHLRAVTVDDALGIAVELDAQLARHLTAYQDEWAATLADPERLGRFVSFVNAPGTPDPSVRFLPERGQIRPATPAGAR
ncbi:nitrite reductase large subunit NirB [Streptomyces sp. NPDC052396]|uniref:nitrite reductase large subunit NirB n=1 Tax=Streptomyces sp. NPDC052396 TaxID=3365689 RepID=UPI0037CF2A62